MNKSWAELVGANREVAIGKSIHWHLVWFGRILTIIIFSLIFVITLFDFGTGMNLLLIYIMVSLICFLCTGSIPGIVDFFEDANKYTKKEMINYG